MTSTRIKILGPWNGDVRVTDLGPDFFELTTLENHPEAGRIRFTLAPHATLPDTVRFEIHSRARSPRRASGLHLRHAGRGPAGAAANLGKPSASG